MGVIIDAYFSNLFADLLFICGESNFILFLANNIVKPQNFELRFTCLIKINLGQTEFGE